MSNKLDHLLAQCDQAISLDDTDRAWLNAEAVGHEMQDEHFVTVQRDGIDYLNETIVP